ncbi:MAG: hypothetical protein JSW08_02610 [archaeon]|nr:MAG: hypothetical protein JSW08_02610 [archaeon]
MDKKAQTMGVPFQLIFTLIIIAVVIVFGFFAIRMFLGRAEQAKFGTAFNEISTEIEEAYSRAGGTAKVITVDMPKGIEAVCFFNQSAPCRDIDLSYDELGYSFCDLIDEYEENFFYWTFRAAMEYKANPNWNITCQNKLCVKIPSGRNPKCFFPDNNRQLQLNITKNFGDPYVHVDEVR